MLRNGNDDKDCYVTINMRNPLPVKNKYKINKIYFQFQEVNSVKYRLYNIKKIHDSLVLFLQSNLFNNQTIGYYIKKITASF